LHIEIHIDGFIEPAGSAELITRVQVGGESVNHYMCLTCNELFEARDEEFVVHDCLPPALGAGDAS
jgi:hypothetical protein